MKSKKGGGMSLYILLTIWNLNVDMTWNTLTVRWSPCSLKLKGGGVNIECNLIIGVLYRMPNACVDVFNERMCDVLNIVQKERKICCCLGDLNIDLLKCENHKPTMTYLENLYTYNVFPLIMKPTRITNESATLMDHVLTNNFDVNSKHMQGILCTSISDHYAIFHMAGNAENASFGGEISPILQRNYSQRNINKFLNEVSEIEWSGFTEMDDAQQAYSAFHKLLAEKYVSCFPFKKIPKRYYHNKPWLTAGLKESIKIKRTSCMSRDLREKTQKINVNSTNHKTSWQILKMVINKRKCTPVCTKFQTNGKVVNDGHEISNKFNRFFVNVGSTLANAIPPTNKNPSEYMTSNKVLFVVLSVT